MTHPDPTLHDPSPHLRLVVACEVTEVPRTPSRPFAHALSTSRTGRAYLTELQTIRPLSREQERTLALRIEQGERQMFEALLALPSVRSTVRHMLDDAAAGRIAFDKVLDESANDEVARARLGRLLNALDRTEDAVELVRLLGEVRIGRQALERLASEAVRQNESLAANVAVGRQVAEVAKRELVRAHLWLAVSIASRHVSRGLDLMDRIQEGNLGLIRAADRFRVRKGFRFATYAAWWVRQAINRAVAEQGHCVRLPPKTLEAAQKAERIQGRYNARTGIATEQDVADSLAVSVDRLREVQHGVSDAVRLDVAEHVLVDASPTPEHMVGALEQRQALLEQLASLEPREQRVLALRFGFEGEEEATRDDVAKVFSLTRERIRQIEKKAIERLQHPTRACILRAV